MEYSIDERPNAAILEVTLAAGEQIETTPGAMMTRTADVTAESSVAGGEGISGMIGRAVSDERGLVDNTYWAGSDEERVSIVAEYPGDIVPLDVSEGGSARVQSGSLLAWEPLVERSTRFNDRSNVLSSGEVTVLGLDGRGMAFVSAYGAIDEREIRPGEPLTVDEDHLVAWTGDLDLERRSDGGVTSTLLGGEGFVTVFRGSGRVWLQSRNPALLRAAASGGGNGGPPGLV